MRYSEIFKVSADALDAKGVFNADVDSDSHLHIDPSLFKNCKIPEFVGAYDEFNTYFAMGKIQKKCGDAVKVEICKRDANALVGEIEEGITAVLMHSELSWVESEKKPALKKIKLGDIVDCCIVNVDYQNEAVYVSLRKLQGNPYIDFVIINKGKDVKAIVDSFDEFGVYGFVNNLRLFVPRSFTYRGKQKYRYNKGKRVDVRVVELNEREDSIVGSFLPFIPSQLEQFALDYHVGDMVDGLSIRKKEQKYLMFQKKYKGVTYELMLPIYEIASSGFVDNLPSLYDNVKLLPLSIKEINEEKNKIYLSLKNSTLRVEGQSHYFEYGKEYLGIVLSRTREGYVLLLLDKWIEVPLQTSKHYNTGEVLTVMPDRLTSPIAFIEAE